MSEKGHCFLIEIISCRDILIGDRTSSDPYVLVKTGSNTHDIHKTKHILKTLNPTFTPDTNNAFLLSCSRQDLDSSEGLLFKVKDWDRIGSNTDLGYIHILPDMLLSLCDNSVEFPKEHKLEVPEKRRKNDSDAGIIRLRCRYATQEDVDNMGGNKAIKGIRGKSNSLKKTFSLKKFGSSSNAGVATTTPTAAAAAAAAATATASSEPTAINLSGKIDIFIQIISCKNILIGDINTSDPYVKILMGNKDLHWTKHIKKTLNPVFDPAQHNSTFTVAPTKQDLHDAGGLTLQVKDWDRIGTNTDLGHVVIPPDVIFQAVQDTTIQEKEFPIIPPSKKQGQDAGTIQIKLGNAVTPYVEGKKTGDNEVEEVDAPFCVEIVSCRGLLIADRKASDPYVKIKLGPNDVHRTKHHIKSLDPIFSVEDDNLYFCDKEKKEIEKLGGMEFIIKDWDRIGTNDDLGMVNIPSEEVYQMIQKGGRCVEYPILAPRGTKMKNASGVVGDAGYLKIMIRKASASEIRQHKIAKESGRSSILGGVFGKKTTDMASFYGEPDLHILCEIVSCRGLMSMDVLGSDPYVKVYLGKDNIHETDYRSHTTCPIYTVKKKCFFILDVAKEHLIDVDGLEFKVKDYDMGSFSGDDMGTVQVPAEFIMNGNGERQEFELDMPGKKSLRKNVTSLGLSTVTKTVTSSVTTTVNAVGNTTGLISSKSLVPEAGFIVLRFRPATKYDRQFLENVTGKGLKSTEFLGHDKGAKDIESKTTKKPKFFRKDVKKVGDIKNYKIRPYKDPENPEHTEWMTKAEIHAEALKPSKKWMDIGSGELGKVFVEVIGCDGLPNTDGVGGSKMTGNVTDPFVTLVYEDSFIKTDVVDDCMSPRFLPWMQRAFIFRVAHISSNLFLGVFDYDGGRNFDHDLIGRISIDLANLRRDTDYMLEYNLYNDSFTPDRKSLGTITLRLRIELKEPKAVVLSTLKLPQPIYTSVPTQKDFKLIRNTIHGGTDMTSFGINTIKFYVDELLQNTELKSVVINGAEAILFWRGQVPIFGMYLPLHSLVLFLVGIILAEKPLLMPSFFFFGIAWFLLGVQNYRNNMPNPWEKTKGFEEIILMLATNRSLGPLSIEAHENEEETIELEKETQRKIVEAAALEEMRERKYMEILKQHEELMEDVEDPDEATGTSISTGAPTSVIGVATKVANPINALKPILYPIQCILGEVIGYIRFVKNVVVWDEPYYATIVVIAATGLGFIFFFIPWRFIITWTTRIVVWLIFGPHMKLVDIFWYSKQKEGSMNKFMEETKAQLEVELENKKASARDARIAQENAEKMKDMKKEMFGDYISAVPVLDMDKYNDIPLFTSVAKPYIPPKMRTRVITERIGGQTLVGDMIPRLVGSKNLRIKVGLKAAAALVSKTNKGDARERKNDPVEKKNK